MIERIIEERKSAEARAERAMPLATHGDVGNGRSSYNNVIATRQGNDPTYLTARIARDRPDILDRMKAGEYRSVRAAALDAGIVKRQWSAPSDPAALARAIRRRLAPAEVDALIEELGAD